MSSNHAPADSRRQLAFPRCAAENQYLTPDFDRFLWIFGSNPAMNDAAGPAKSEMLAAARKKLRDFEKQRADGRNSPASSIVSSEPGGGAGLNGRSSVVSEDSSTLQPSRNGVSASPFQPNGNEWYSAYTQLKAQHDELCSHYAQLHSAYSQVNANGVHVDAENQIVQLQAALSTMVEEKVACQSDLRQANEQIERLKRELSEKTKAPHPETGSSSVDLKALQEIIAQKDGLLTARHLELESARKEVAAIQANLLNVQHERSEAQARVKSLIKETAAQESRSEQLKKEIQMKDLYLKQLGATGTPSNPNVTEHLDSEISTLRTEKSRLLSEISTLKTHYAEREQHLQQKQQEMAQELENAQTHAYSADERIQQLQHELQVVNDQLASAAAPEELVEAPVVTEAEISKRIHEACLEERGRWQRKLDEEQRNREEEKLDKDRLIFEREQSLAELEMKYRLLEERTLESTANGADLLSLSEQLQNEKATVSRAVAQNKELKERLLETEDRFVVLTEEKAAVELAKQSAEHQVKELTKQLNLEAAGLVGNIADVIASQPHLESKPSEEDNELKEALETLKQENSEIRADLEQKNQELMQTRAELRRSTTHNEQMDEIMRQNAEDENQNSIHVELTQAITRVQELASENEQLREALTEIQRQLEQEREDRKEISVAEKSEIELMEVEPVIEPVNEPVVEQEPGNTKLHEDLWARKELEKRFARAMLQNAELAETIDRLEHINQQLELENDTIADHVVLYQHQRKLVRERLRVKDEQLKTMEEERVKTVARCQELQNVLMTVLNKGGVLKEYESTKRKAARRVSRSYSHSTVDEMSGDEDVVVDGRMQEVPERAEVHGEVIEEEKAQETSNFGAVEEHVELNEERSSPKPAEPSDDASVRRILEIISDISRPPVLPAGQLHCTQCIGPLQNL